VPVERRRAARHAALDLALRGLRMTPVTVARRADDLGASCGAMP